MIILVENIKELTSVELHGSQSKRCAHPEYSCNNRHDVNNIAHPPVYPVAYQRVETGLHRHRQSFPGGDNSSNIKINYEYVRGFTVIGCLLNI